MAQLTQEQATALDKYVGSLQGNEKDNFISEFEKLSDTGQNGLANDLIGMNRPLSPEQQVGKDITNRPSALKNLINIPITNPITRTIKHPLQTLGAGMEIGEGIPADIALALQRGTLKGLGGDIAQTLQGQRPAQYGDVMRASGNPILANPLVSGLTGLILASTKYSPSGAVGNLPFQALQGLGKVTTAGIQAVGKQFDVGAHLSNLAQNIGIKPASLVVSMLTGKPRSFIEDAMQNPEYLNTNWLKKTAETVGEQMRTVVNPLEKNTSLYINSAPARQILSKVDLLSAQNYQPIRWSDLSPSQLKIVKDWTQQIQFSKQMTFGKIRSLVRQMDSYLSPVYNQTAQGIDQVNATKFQEIVGTMRTAVRSLINNSNFPEANAVIGADHIIKTAQNVQKQLQGIKPGLFRAIYARLGIMGMGKVVGASTGLLSIPAALTAATLSVPSVWSGRFGLLRGGAGLQNAIMRNPAVIPNILRNLPQQQTQE